MSQNPFPTFYQEFIAKSRYSRWLDTENRREHWDETVNRYLDFFDKKVKEDHPQAYEKYVAIRPDLYSAIYNLEVMPSMRCLMTAGKALEKNNIAGFNPVVGSTLVQTYELGMSPISTLVGSDVKVLNVEGRWADAVFNSYGVQKTYEVLCKLNTNTVNTVECTANHRWVLSSGDVRSTDQLKPNDKIKFVAAPKPVVAVDNIDYKLGVLHGIIYGDGTAAKSCKRVKGYHIRLCSHIEDLLPLFKDYAVTYPPSAGGDPVIMMYDGFAKTHSLKDLPEDTETDEYLLGFVRGWLAADGAVTRSSQVSLCTVPEGVEWFYRVATRLGYVVQRTYKQSSTTNYGERKRDSINISISRSSCVAEDFLCSEKRARFKPLDSEYTVYSVTPTGREEEVFCATVEDTNTFVLDKGLVTGNCAYAVIDHPRIFDEILLILMSGTGVGFSVERQYISKLPAVSDEFYDTETTIVVKDSRVGWAAAFRELLGLLWIGQVPKLDLSKLRPAGAKLKTFGGRSSGPAPLLDLFNFSIHTFKNAAGRKLTSLECHDLVCKTGEVVVSGGTRRSATLSLSNLSDDRMRAAKTGQWWVEHPHRALANNSAVYTEKPEFSVFLKEWTSLYDSKAGERGIFSRAACQKQAAKNGKRSADIQYGCNPCSEIILRPNEFCNLSEAVVRAGDTEADIARKIRIAAIFGTLQSALTDFPYLRKVWRDNCDEERLLGVSLTGILDNLGALSDLDKLKNIVVEENAKWADLLGIPHSAATTTCKPSGTCSQLVDSSSGIHPRFAQYYIRRVRADKTDPLAMFMISKGFDCEDDSFSKNAFVFSFPMKAPDGAVLVKDVSAMDQIKLWERFSEEWCEHKVSQTVYYKDSEFLEIGNWVYNNIDKISGISFLPVSDHIYKQAPYEEITKEQYEALVASTPKGIDWAELAQYETEEGNTGVRELACTGAACEVVDLVS